MNSNMDCLFCKIIAGEIPSKVLYEDDKIFAFYDIQPQAPIHFLVIPKTHLDGADQIDETNAEIVSYIFAKIPTLAAMAGIKNGFRVVTNVLENGGQSVRHLHFHVLGGGKLNVNFG
ncbi:MAG: histidine triad nucleotide-binding protein [Clostridiales bacterium]|nr:histidine triad nucleotide-binding protein [Clostridiales bacterium]